MVLVAGKWCSDSIPRSRNNSSLLENIIYQCNFPKHQENKNSGRQWCFVSSIVGCITKQEVLLLNKIRGKEYSWLLIATYLKLNAVFSYQETIDSYFIYIRWSLEIKIYKNQYLCQTARTFSCGSLYKRKWKNEQSA